jgi:hypothetical protein
MTPEGRGHRAWQGCSSGHSSSSPVANTHVMLVLSSRHSAASDTADVRLLLHVLLLPLLLDVLPAPGPVAAAAAASTGVCRPSKVALLALPAPADAGVCRKDALLPPALCAAAAFVLVHQVGK